MDLNSHQTGVQDTRSTSRMLRFSLVFLAIGVLCRDNVSASFDYKLEALELCPYSKFCTSEPKLPLPGEEFESCCAPCSCHEFCHVIKSCCPDFNSSDTAHVKEQSEVVFECTDQDTVYNIPRGISRETPVENGFRIIDICFMTNETCSGFERLEDLITVSDVGNEFVFKNRRCAECNGFTDIVEWTLEIRSMDILLRQFSSTQDKEAFIISHCPVRSYPPSNGVGRKSNCRKSLHIKSTCKSTTLWEVYDEGTAKACMSYSQLYSHFNPVGMMLVYNNVFCFLCNHRKMMTDNSLCIKQDDGYEKDFGRVSFRAILNMKSSSQHTAATSSNKNGILDPFTNEYEELFCPLASIPIEGHCQPIVSLSQGMSITIVYQVQFSNLLRSFLQKNETEFQQLVISYIKSHLSMEKYGCLICIDEIYISEDTLDNSFVMVYMSTTVSCNYLLMANLIHELLFKETSFRLNASNTKWDILATLTDYNKITRTLDKKIISTKYFRCTDAVTVQQLLRFIDCPRIRKSVQNLTQLGINVSEILNTTQNYDRQIIRLENSTDHVLICVDFYFLLLNSSPQSIYGVGFEMDSLFISVLIPRTATMCMCIFASAYAVLKKDMNNLQLYFFSIFNILFVLSQAFFLFIHFITSPRIIYILVIVLHYIWALLFITPTTITLLSFLKIKMLLTTNRIISANMLSFISPAPLLAATELLHSEQMDNPGDGSDVLKIFLYAPRMISAVILVNALGILLLAYQIRSCANDYIVRKDLRIVYFCILFIFLLCSSWLAGVLYEITGLMVLSLIQSILCVANCICIVSRLKLNKGQLTQLAISMH